PVINPMIVEGQVHGAVAQGISEALAERIVYDDSGQILTGSFMDYALPTAADLPSFTLGHLETPSPLTPGGHKGMGEGGTIGAPLRHRQWGGRCCEAARHRDHVAADPPRDAGQARTVSVSLAPRVGSRLPL